MKNSFIIFLLAVFITSCGSSKRATNTGVIGKEKPRTSKVTKNKADRIVRHAIAFEGTKYKYGGTTRKGMDCSGLVYVSFNSEAIALPRVSREMATRGKKISLSQTSKGDLVFFQTNKNRRVINHVGLVVRNDRGDIQFIHSTSSRGVIVSSLSEKYWKNAFVEVRRII